MTAAAPKGAMSHHRNAAACHFYIKRDAAAGPEVPHAEDILWVQAENLHGNRKPSPPQAFVSSPPHRLMPETLRRVATSLREIQLSQLCFCTHGSFKGNKKKPQKKPKVKENLTEAWRRCTALILEESPGPMLDTASPIVHARRQILLSAPVTLKLVMLRNSKHGGDGHA